MSSEQEQQGQSITINITLCESCDPSPITPNTGSLWLIFSYLIARIVFVIIFSVSEYFSLNVFGSQSLPLSIFTIITLIRLTVPATLLILFLRRRYAFLKGTIVVAVLDAVFLLRVAQSVVSANFQLDSLTLLSYLSILLQIVSIIIAKYVNNSKLIREYFIHTPSSDHQKIVENHQPSSEEDLKKLIGIRGWFGLFTVYLCLVIVMTIAVMTWFLMQVSARTGTPDFGFELSAAVFLGAMFYIFPLISLIRLSRKRIDFRNSYITGTIIDTIMFLILLVVPDGKIFRPFVPYMSIGVVLMIVWGLYLFRSRRVILSCPNGKPDKGARIDGHKWRKLY